MEADVDRTKLPGLLLMAELRKCLYDPLSIRFESPPTNSYHLSPRIQPPSMSSRQLRSAVTPSVARPELTITRPNPVDLEEIPDLYTFTNSDLEEINVVPLNRKDHRGKDEAKD